MSTYSKQSREKRRKPLRKRAKRLDIDVSSLTAMLLLFMLSAVASVWASYDRSLSFPILFAIIINVVLSLTIIYNNVSVLWLSKGIVFIAALLSFYFITQYSHFDYFLETGGLARLGRLTSSLFPNMIFFTPHINAVAGFVMAPCVLGFVLTKYSKKTEQFIWGTCTLLIIYSLLITSSRGAWLGLVAVTIIWFAMRSKRFTSLRTIHYMAIIGIVISMVLIAGFIFQEKLLSSDTISSRYILYRNSFYLMEDYLFTGVGVGQTFAFVYSYYQLIIPHAFLSYSHNIFLSIGVGLGIFGLVIFLGMIISFYIIVFQVEKSNRQSGMLFLFRANWLGVTATLIHGFMDAPQFAPDYWTMSMLFAQIALSVAIGRKLGRKVIATRTSKSNKQKSKNFSFWIPLLIIAIMLIAVFRQSIRTSWYANMGAVYHTWSDLSPRFDDTTKAESKQQAIAYFDKTLELNPNNSVANKRLGLIALAEYDFDKAMPYLQKAYNQRPNNQSVLKGLGMVYLWRGELDSAQNLLQQLDDQAEIIEELGNYSWWWGTQNRTDLAEYAAEMVERLKRNF